MGIDIRRSDLIKLARALPISGYDSSGRATRPANPFERIRVYNWLLYLALICEIGDF